MEDNITSELNNEYKIITGNYLTYKEYKIYRENLSTKVYTKDLIYSHRKL